MKALNAILIVIGILLLASWINTNFDDPKIVNIQEVER